IGAVLPCRKFQRKKRRMPLTGMSISSAIDLKELWRATTRRFRTLHCRTAGFFPHRPRVQTGVTEDLMRRNPKVIPVRSTLLSVVLILSAVLFVSLVLVSCRSESDARQKAEGLPSNPPKQTRTRAASMQPPPAPEPAVTAAKVQGVAGGVVGRVEG